MADEPDSGYCFVQVEIDDWEPALMADLRPGDPFKFVIDEGLFADVVMNEAAPDEQRYAVLQGLLKRSPIYRYEQRTDPNPDTGQECCVAEEAE